MNRKKRKRSCLKGLEIKKEQKVVKDDFPMYLEWSKSKEKKGKDNVYEH